MADDSASDAVVAGGMAVGGPMAAAAAGQMMLELSSFVKFCQKIDEIVRDLKSTKGLPSEVARETLTRANFGGGEDGWAEASGLYRSYDSVVSELENLLKVMTNTIEGMGIAVMASHEGYDNLEQSTKQRMIAIRQQAEVYYEKAGRDAQGGQASKPDPTQQPGESAGGDTSGSSGL